MKRSTGTIWFWQKDNMSLENDILNLVKRTKAASREIGLLSTTVKNDALKKMANALLRETEYLKKENAKDLLAAEKASYAKALIDRLRLSDKTIKGMADCLLDTAKLKDPVGEIIDTYKRPNGLVIKKVRVPIGVVGIIYESRPNVTSDCIGLCLKSGNAVILKGGKEAFYSNQAIFKVLQSALKNTKIPLEAIQLLSSTDREAVNILLKQDKYVDLIVPRGGEGLIKFVAEHSSIPVIKHYKGVCHTYVAKSADVKMAHNICMNAKVQRPGVCNAMETMLVQKDVAKKFLPSMIRDLQNAGVEIRGDEKTRQIVKDHIKKATEEDWSTEYLDLILSVKVVDNVQAAIDHINTYGSQHSDTIVTKDKKEAEAFLRGVDSATVYVNASTRFTDGYEFGFGAEVGISTDKIHARGPMGLEGLTTYKFEIFGTGQVRQ